MSFDSLKARFDEGEFEPGAWFVGNDAAVGGPGKPARRFVLVSPYLGGPSVRMASRTTTAPPPTVAHISHLAHRSHHQRGCAVDRDGYIRLYAKPVALNLLTRYSCDDPDVTLVARLRESAAFLGGRI